MKFDKGDKAIICYNAGVRNDFLKHCFEIGTEVEISEPFTGWKGHEAYYVKINGRISSEVLLAEELESVSNNKLKTNNMKNPKIIEPVISGATYKVPTFKVTSEGIEDGAGIEIVFCKGNKEDESALRQEGVFTETLIQTAKEYLESVNVGPLATRETSMVITKLDEALMWIAKRAEDRKLRGVQGTYNK